MLTKDQIAQIKQQIIEQIKSTFPENKKQQAVKKVNSMNSEELENFLKKNQILKGRQQIGGTECIFCSIVDKKIPSFEIEETKDSLVVLELNPISKAHCLVIPKKHVSSEEEIPKPTLALAKKIAKEIKTKFKPQDVKLFFQNLLGHEIINILPIYSDETPESGRKKADPKELQKLQKELKKKEKKKPIEKINIKSKKKGTKPKKTETKLWLPKRIP